MEFYKSDVHIAIRKLNFTIPMSILPAGNWNFRKSMSILQSKMSYGPQRLIYIVITTTKENNVLESGNYYCALIVMLIGVSDL